jgi:hypothetical protein
VTAAGLEDARADKDTVAAELHHHGGVSRRRDTARSKVDDGQAAQLGRLLEQRVVDLQLLGVHAQLLLAHVLCALDLGVDGARVADRFDHVARTGLALCADHGGAFGDAAERLAQATAAADERHAERVLGYVVDGVSGRQDFRLVNVVYAESFEDLAGVSVVELSQ